MLIIVPQGSQFSRSPLRGFSKPRDSKQREREREIERCDAFKSHSRIETAESQALSPNEHESLVELRGLNLL